MGDLELGGSADMGGRGRRTDGESTADRFLDTAERLFANLGYQGTSVRAIAKEAGVNLGALHYYWGSKAALYRAVIARRLTPMNAERLRRFAECEQAAAEGRADLRAILEAFVRPAMHMGDADPAIAHITRRLYQRMVSDPFPEVQQLSLEVYSEVSRRFIGLLRPCCAHLTAEEFFWRVQTAYGVVRFYQGVTPWLALVSEGEFKGDDPDEGTRHIVEALHGALMAPSIAR